MAEAERSLLQAQVEPHFLNNTLRQPALARADGIRSDALPMLDHHRVPAHGVFAGDARGELHRWPARWRSSGRTLEILRIRMGASWRSASTSS
jgi:hypothetical protein